MIRWLSLINLLQSIVRLYKATQRVFVMQSKFNGIDEDILKQLIRLLKPFKHVLKILQSTNTPSLYMVLICTLMLKKAVASFDEMMKYQVESSTNDSPDIENDIVEEIGDVMEHEDKQNVFFSFTEISILLFFFIYFRNQNSSFKSIGIIESYVSIRHS